MIYLDGLIALLLLLIFVSALVSMINELVARFFNLRARELFKLVTDPRLGAQWARPVSGMLQLFGTGGKRRAAGPAEVRRHVLQPCVEALRQTPAYHSPLGKLGFEDIRRRLRQQVPGLAPQARAEFNVKLAATAPARRGKLAEQYRAYADALEQTVDELLSEARAAFARRVQFFGFLIALVLAGFFNIDSVNLFGRLVNDAALRAQVTTRLAEGGALAEVQKKLATLAQSEAQDAEAWRQNLGEAALLLDSTTGGLAGLDLEIGLGRGFWDHWQRPAFRDPARNGQLWLWHLWVFLAWCGGILLTAVLVSFGSPYLYDALQLVSQARRVGAALQPAGRVGSVSA